jgi:hypothetical protein
MLDDQAIDELVQYGRGVAAEYVGATYDVYRLRNFKSSKPPYSDGSIVSQMSRVMRGYKCRMIRTNSAVAIEQTDIYDMMFAMLGDATCMKVGDVLVRTGGFRNDGEIFTIAQLRPMSYNMAIRTEVEGSIARPYGQGDSEQLLGYVAYQGAGKTYEKNYTLKQGWYYISEPEDIPAMIPFGIQPYKRLGPTPEIKQPTTTHRTEVFAYVPLLPGLLIEPGDMLADQNGNRYQIHNVNVFTTGLQGYQLIAESVFV